MEPVSVILTALAAGAAKTAGEVAGDAYSGLKAMIKKRFEEKDKADEGKLLEKYEEKPDKTEALLKDELTEAEVDKDEEILQKAQELLKVLKPQEAAAGAFNVTITGGTVQGLTQQNTGTINQTFN